MHYFFVLVSLIRSVGKIESEDVDKAPCQHWTVRLHVLNTSIVGVCTSNNKERKQAQNVLNSFVLHRMILVNSTERISYAFVFSEQYFNDAIT